MSEALDVLNTFLTGVLVGLGVAYLAVKWGFRQARREMGLRP